jgi:multiple sugar transport system substrate-binding protein
MKPYRRFATAAPDYTGVAQGEDADVTDNYWTRRMSRRRLLYGAGAITGASALSALLAACGSNSSGSSTPSGSAAPAAKANPVDAVDLTGKKVQITLWHHLTGANATTFQSIVDAFNSSQNSVVVQAQNQGNSYDDLYKKLLTAASANGLPDLAEAYPNQVSDYQQGNVVVVLDDYINSSKYGLTKAEQDDFVKPYWNESIYPEYGGKHLSFPFSKSFLVMYYNADKLKALNYAKPPDQWTWDDFVAVGRAANNSGTKGWIINIDPSTLDMMIFSRGGKLISDDQKHWLTNQQPGVDSLALHEQAVREGWGYLGSSSSSGAVDFGAGKVLMDFATSAGIAAEAKTVAGAGNFNWSISIPPHNAGVSPVTVLYGGSITAFKSTPERQLAAWLFMKYFASPEVTAKWSLATGYTPLRQSAVQSDAVQQAIKNDPRFGVLVNQIAQYGRPGTSVHGTADMRTFESDAMTQAVTQPNTNPKTILDAVVQKGDQATAQG